MGLPALPPEEVMTQRGEGFIELRQKLISTCNHAEQTYTLELNVEWEMPQVLSFHTDFGEFARHVAIVGSEVDAQVATCEAYIQEYFTSAKDLLPGLQAVWDSGNLYEVSPGEGNLHHLLVMVYGPEKERATVVASGSSSSIIDTAQACAFFCCAVRMTSLEGISLSTFTFDLTKATKRTLSSAYILHGKEQVA